MSMPSVAREDVWKESASIKKEERRAESAITSPLFVNTHGKNTTIAATQK